MRGIKKLHLMAQNHTQIHGHGDSMTESAQWGQFSENNKTVIEFSVGSSSSINDCILNAHSDFVKIRLKLVG